MEHVVDSRTHQLSFAAGETGLSMAELGQRMRHSGGTESVTWFLRSDGREEELDDAFGIMGEGDGMAQGGGVGKWGAREVYSNRMAEDGRTTVAWNITNGGGDGELLGPQRRRERRD